MSAVSSVGGSAQSLYQFIQSLGAGGTTQANPGAAPDASSSTSSASSAGAGQPQQVASAGEHHRHHRGGGGGTFQKIESAVSSALQSAQTDGNSDPNKVIRDAIAKVFQDQGAGASSAGAAQKSASDPDGDGNGDGPGKVDSDGNSGRQAFLQSLQSLGVSAQQFHSDFLAAVQQAQDGQVNVATAMRSFPPGSTVDTIA